MIHKLFQSFSHRFVSRWVIFAKDLIILASALMAAYLLRFNFVLSSEQVAYMGLHLGTSTAMAIISFLIFKPYEGIIRHTSVEDIMRLSKSLFMLAVMLVLLNLTSYYFPGFYHQLPYSILIIYIVVGSFMLLFSRMAIKILFSTFSHSDIKRDNILIYGAGQGG
ncbi:MAG: hypothetical protein HGA37_15545, partial [Lentimicrobium sp.]|nr:hypothetical protein [Lentimicrobium sp.]